MKQTNWKSLLTIAIVITSLTLLFKQVGRAYNIKNEILIIIGMTIMGIVILRVSLRSKLV